MSEPEAEFVIDPDAVAEPEKAGTPMELHIDHVDPADRFMPASNDEARRVYVFMQLAGQASEIGDGDEFVRTLRATETFLRTGEVAVKPVRPPKGAKPQLITRD